MKLPHRSGFNGSWIPGIFASVPTADTDHTPVGSRRWRDLVEEEFFGYSAELEEEAALSAAAGLDVVHETQASTWGLLKLCGGEPAVSLRLCTVVQEYSGVWNYNIT